MDHTSAPPGAHSSLWTRNQARLLLGAAALLTSLTAFGGGYSGWLAASVIACAVTCSVLGDHGWGRAKAFPPSLAAGVAGGLLTSMWLAPTAWTIDLTAVGPGPARTVHTSGNPFCVGECPATTYRMSMSLDEYHEYLLSQGFVQLQWVPDWTRDPVVTGSGIQVAGRPPHYRIRSINVWVQPVGEEGVEATFAGIPLSHQLAHVLKGDGRWYG